MELSRRASLKCRRGCGGGIDGVDGQGAADGGVVGNAKASTAGREGLQLGEGLGLLEQSDGAGGVGERDSAVVGEGVKAEQTGDSAGTLIFDDGGPVSLLSMLGLEGVRHAGEADAWGHLPVPVRCGGSTADVHGEVELLIPVDRGVKGLFVSEVDGKIAASDLNVEIGGIDVMIVGFAPDLRAGGFIIVKLKFDVVGTIGNDSTGRSKKTSLEVEGGRKLWGRWWRQLRVYRLLVKGKYGRQQHQKAK